MLNRILQRNASNYGGSKNLNETPITENRMIPFCHISFFVCFIHGCARQSYDSKPRSRRKCETSSSMRHSASPIQRMRTLYAHSAPTLYTKQALARRGIHTCIRKRLVVFVFKQIHTTTRATVRALFSVYQIAMNIFQYYLAMVCFCFFHSMNALELVSVLCSCVTHMYPMSFYG